MLIIKLIDTTNFKITQYTSIKCCRHLFRRPHIFFNSYFFTLKYKMSDTDNIRF